MYRRQSLQCAMLHVVEDYQRTANTIASAKERTSQGFLLVRALAIRGPASHLQTVLKMAEIALVASIFGVAAFGTRIATSLYEAAEIMIHAHQQIASMAKHVSQFTAILRHLGRVLEAEKGSCSDDLLREIRKIKRSCKITFKEIRSTFQSKKYRPLVPVRWLIRHSQYLALLHLSQRRLIPPSLLYPYFTHLTILVVRSQSTFNLSLCLIPSLINPFTLFGFGRSDRLNVYRLTEY